MHNKKGKPRTNVLKSTVFEHNTVEGDTGPVGIQVDIGLVGIETGDGLVGVHGSIGEVGLERGGGSVGEQGSIGEVSLERWTGSVGGHGDGITDGKIGGERVRNERVG